MTLSEDIKIQEELSKMANAIERAQQNCIFNRFIAQDNSLIQSLSPSDIAFMEYIRDKILPMRSKFDYDSLIKALDAFSYAQILPPSDMHKISDIPSMAILDHLSETLLCVEPYLPSEEQEKCESVIRPKLSKKSRTRLTLSDALSILSILLSILFFVLGSMPDDQAERIIQQQNKIISNQEAEIAQLREKDQVLLDTLNSLSDSINLLTNEIELLRDELEDSDDPPDSPSQAEPGDPQQDDSDSQD